MAGIWNSKRIINASVVEGRTSERLPGALYVRNATKNSEDIGKPLNTSMRTKIGIMHDIDDCNVNTNALNAVSRCPKENITLTALRAEKGKVSGRKKNGKRKRPPRTGTLKRPNRISLSVVW